MNSLLMEVEKVISTSAIEFHRADAIERYEKHKLLYFKTIQHICDDINMNVPYYYFYITIRNKCVKTCLSSRECDPLKTAGELLYGFPLVNIERRALTLPHLYRVNKH